MNSILQFRHKEQKFLNWLGDKFLFKYKHFLLLWFTGLVGTSLFQMIIVVVNSDDTRSSLSLMGRLLH